MKSKNVTTMNLTHETQANTLEALKRTRRQLIDTNELAGKTLEHLEQQEQQFNGIVKDVDLVDAKLNKAIELQKKVSLYSCLCQCFFFSRPKSEPNISEINQHTPRDVLRQRIAQSQENRKETQEKQASVFNSSQHRREYSLQYQGTDTEVKKELNRIDNQNKMVDEAVADLEPMLDALISKANEMKSHTNFFNEQLDTSQPKIDKVLNKTLKVAERSRQQKLYA